MKRFNIIAIFLIILFGISLVNNSANAEVDPIKVRLDSNTIIKGYTINYNQTTHPEWGDLRVGVLPNLVNEEVTFEVKPFDDNLPNPPGTTRVSDYYIYDILRTDPSNSDPLILNKPFVLALKFDGIKNYYRKRIYYWNSISESWVALPSSADYDNQYVRAYTHLPFSRIAVFEDTADVNSYSLEGKASFLSWPSHRDGVASNDYPMGTKLRVRNVNNGKTVDVTVYSTGPFVDFSQRRIIDLSKTAFAQIEDTWKGLVRVQVWPIGDGIKVLGVETYSFDEHDDSTHVAPVPQVESGVPEPHPQSTAAIAIDEKTNKILYSKNYDTVLPIASLTKLMTASVFLDTGTSFDKVVTYLAEDDAVGSRLRINNGETLTVKDLFYTTLVGSANNAANALARSTGLSTEEFVQKMNDKAQAWGLTHTKFAGVSGLNTNNVSTVYEIALMAKYILNDFRMLQGTTTTVYSFRTINTDEAHTIKSSAKGVTNGTIDSSLFITGMKTGYLDEAGYCFMLKASRGSGEGNVISVILGANDSNMRYNETNDLINYGLSNI
ncbi:MAG: RlpA-like double-psi beta-barrel domain-containing protein [Candidatus Kerfeldbacteria bacterium]